MEMEHPLTAEVRATVSRLMRETQFGSLTLTVQDGRVVQLERNDRFLFPATVKAPARLAPGSSTDESGWMPGLSRALSGLRFGQVIVKIQSGRVVQLDRTEKRRWPDLTGVGGEGI